MKSVLQTQLQKQEVWGFLHSTRSLEVLRHRLGSEGLETCYAIIEMPNLSYLGNKVVPCPENQRSK